MPNSCAAYGCNNKIGPDTKEKKITFHLLPPATDSRRKLWISNSRRIDPLTRQPWNPTSKYVYFCSEHFMLSDFENPNSKPSARKLKENAVPTVFTFPTVPPPSPTKQSNIPSSTETQNPSPVDDAAIKNKPVSRFKKAKHRKVVMLPKKIKLLQETSAANVESVTIISFQHLEYDENMQKMLEEAKLDLQYSDESECEPGEEEYFEDEYTELRNSIPFEEEEVLNSTLKCITNKKQTESVEQLDSNNLISENDKEDSLGLDASKTLENADASMTEESPDRNNTTSDKCEDPRINTSIQKENQLSTKKSSQLESERKGVKRSKTFSKRKIPVVIKELIMIDDIEELRKKAFRIAEDNIKLKRQVTYLEKKLETLVSQLY